MDFARLRPRRIRDGGNGVATQLVRRGLAHVRHAEQTAEERHLRWRARALAFAASLRGRSDSEPVRAANPLRSFVDSRREGRGIWKWDHYLDVYDRHFARFRGREVHVVEIGVYSGGSLDLWRDYFGPRSRVYGIDVEESCLRYAGEQVEIFIGDQADREFWRRFRAEVPRIDVVVDDGGHTARQQAITFEELLPHLSPGGVYVTEDIHGSENAFGAYVAGLTQALDEASIAVDIDDPERRSVSLATGFQSMIDSIHRYPFLTVVEKRRSPVSEFVAPKRGTDWESFLG